MTPELDSASRALALAAMGRTFEQLARELRDLGANLSVWDDRGDRVGAFQPPGEFCRAVYRAGGACDAAMRQVAHAVLDTSGPATARCALGCCVAGVPVRKRRRLSGAAVTCTPVRSMQDEEALARLCDGLELDRQIMTDYACRACTFPDESADLLATMLAKLLGAEHSAQTAQDELATLSANLATTYEELSLLYRISGSMRVTQGPEEFLQTICDELLDVMNIEHACAVVQARDNEDADIVVQSGGLALSKELLADLFHRHIVPQHGPFARAVVDNQFRRKIGTTRLDTVVAVPLATDQGLRGALIAWNKVAGEFDSVDLKLLSSVGNQTATFLANSRLYADMQDLLLGALHALTSTIDAKDPYTCGHSHRVALISRTLAKTMGLDEHSVQEIYLSGLLHDIGKIGVPEATLRKSGRLTDAEYEGLKRHPALGAKILGGIRQLEHMLPGIQSHHERPDGKGYPEGLSGDEVPLAGRIVGLADSFDAMTSDRTYRKALPLEVVVDEIRTHAGTQFDAEIVDTLLSLDLEALLADIRRPAHDVAPVQLIQEPGT